MAEYSNSHKSSIIPISSVVTPTDSDTIFLAHYDITENEVIYGIAPNPGAVFTLRPYEGIYGGGIAIEEPTSNMLGTSSQDWSLWSHYNSSQYWHQARRGQYNDDVMGKVFYGVATGNSTYLYRYYPFALTSGSSYTTSVYLRSDTNIPSRSISAYINSSVGGQHDVGTNVTHTGIGTAWRRYESTFIARETTPSGGIGWSLGALPSGTTLYAAMPQLEQKDFATSFVSGSRLNGNLYYPDFIDYNQGTFSCWAKTHTGATNKNIFFQWDTTGTTPSHFGLGMEADGRIRFSYGTQNIYSPTSHNDGQWHHYAITWKNGTSELHLYVDGVRVASSSAAVTIQNTGGRSQGRFPIGTRGWTYSDMWWNGIIDEMRVDKIARSDDEILSWYISGAPFSPKGVWTIAY
jgi:hypothetical protein